MHGCVLLWTDLPSLLPPVHSHRSSLGPDAFVSRCREAAALAAVRYARLADEKNKQRRNTERQKEWVDGRVGGQKKERERKSEWENEEGEGNIDGEEKENEREGGGRYEAGKNVAANSSCSRWEGKRKRTARGEGKGQDRPGRPGQVSKQSSWSGPSK